MYVRTFLRARFSFFGHALAVYVIKFSSRIGYLEGDRSGENWSGHLDDLVPTDCCCALGLEGRPRRHREVARIDQISKKGRQGGSLFAQEH